MRIESKAASIAWKLVLVACATGVLLDVSGILASSHAASVSQQFSTIFNIFACTSSLAAIRFVMRKDDEQTVSFVPTRTCAVLPGIPLSNDEGRISARESVAWTPLTIERG